jgi:hypothetical protein
MESLAPPYCPKKTDDLFLSIMVFVEGHPFPRLGALIRRCHSDGTHPLSFVR